MAFQLKNNCGPQIVNHETLERELLLNGVSQGILEYIQAIPDLSPDDWEEVQHRVGRKIHESTKIVWDLNQ